MEPKLVSWVLELNVEHKSSRSILEVREAENIYCLGQ